MTPVEKSADAASAARLGLLLAFASAIGYTGTNACLKLVSEYDPAWVSAIKAVWLVLIFAPWVARLAAKNELKKATLKDWGLIVSSGLIGQFGGNLAFQQSLEYIGISVAIPVCLASMVGSSAIVGRLRYGEALHYWTVAGMVLMLAAVWYFTYGTPSDASSENIENSREYWGGLLAFCGGLAYSTMGFFVRSAVKSGFQPAFPMLIIGLVGVFGLGGVGFSHIGITGIQAITGTAWLSMSAAGLLNAAAFLALTTALKSVSVLYANLVNVTQVAMAAAIGVIWMGEEPTVDKAIGWGLTISGFLLFSVPAWLRGK